MHSRLYYELNIIKAFFKHCKECSTKNILTKVPTENKDFPIFQNRRQPIQPLKHVIIFIAIINK